MQGGKGRDKGTLQKFSPYKMFSDGCLWLACFLAAPVLGYVSRRQCREWWKCIIKYSTNSSNTTVILGCLRCCRGRDDGWITGE